VSLAQPPLGQTWMAAGQSCRTFSDRIALLRCGNPDWNPVAVTWERSASASLGTAAENVLDRSGAGWTRSADDGASILEVPCHISSESSGRSYEFARNIDSSRFW